MRCPKCRHVRLVEVALTMGQRKVTMRSCSRCDTRWWDSEGESLNLPRVLELASTR
ncbi:MAG TPA: hypothetical protein VFA94_03740 [Acidimicrobiales bacterium]|nr:hypothetical protein [Acidimicrobiales bacterium]